MTERAEFDARKESDAFGAVRPHYGQRWPDGAPWPDSSEHRQPQLAPLPLPRVRAENLEDAVRGGVFALAAVPIGVGLWLILWKLGWVASLLALGTAVGAARLYLAGSTAGRGGAISRRGAWVVAAVTAATVLLALLGTAWLAAAEYFGAQPLALLFEPEAWELLAHILANDPAPILDRLGNFQLTLLFSGLSCFFPLRQLFAQSRRG